MTTEEAASVVYQWLSTLPIQCSPLILASDLGGQRFRLAAEQLFPVHTVLRFELVPLDVADCYEIKEVSAT